MPSSRAGSWGLTLALGRYGQRNEAEHAGSVACEQVDAVERANRVAAIVRAGIHAVQDRLGQAVATLREMLATAKSGPGGWLSE